VVARYHKRVFGLFGGKSRYQWLEIMPDGMPIIDEILMTFLWVERRRRGEEHPQSSKG